jgi:hypothetical protein
MALNINCLRGYLATTLLFGVGFSAPQAWSGVYLETTFLPAYTQSNTGVGSLGGNFSGGSLSSEAGFSYDLRATIGYLYRGVLIGYSYNLAQAPLSRSASTDAASLDRTTNGSQMGGTLGYLSGRFRLIGTFLFMGQKKRSERQVQSDSTVIADYTLENKGGIGYQFVVGYDFTISGKLKIGPSLVYSSVRYKTQTLKNDLDPSANYTDQDFTTKAIESNLQPMITLQYQF